MSFVDIYQFRDYREFLRAWFKAAQRRPSMRTFASRVGCSTALVSEISNGRRNLEAKWQERFAVALKLDDDERAYFELLVESERSPSLAVQRALDQRLAEVVRFRTSEFVAEASYRAFSEWHYMAIAELASCDGFRGDPEWIASQLRPRISEEDAAEALETLLAIGRLKRVGDEIVAAELPWVTQHHVLQDAVAAALKHVYRDMFALATNALEEVDQDDRHMTSVYVPIPVSLVPEVKERISSFYEGVIDLCAKHGEGAEVVYQLGTQFFPLTRSG